MARLRHALSWLYSIFLLDNVLYFYTVVLGSVSLAGSLFDSNGRFQHRVARTWARMILRTCRVRLELRGWDQADHARPHIYCANHLSLMDTPVVFALPIEFRILAKKGLFRIPFLGWHLRRSGHMPVDRASVRASLRSFEQAAGKIRAGTSLFFFPEGERSDDGRLGEFLAGPFLLAIKAGVPVVPVTIVGTREVLPPGSLHIHARPVTLTVHEPVPTAGMTLRDVERLILQVRERVASALPPHMLPPDRVAAGVDPAAPETNHRIPTDVTD